MSNLSCKLFLPVCQFQQTQSLVHMAGLKSPATDQLQLFAGHNMWIKENFSGIGILPKDKILSSISAEMDPFSNCLWNSYTFQDDISTIRTSRCQYLFSQFFNGTIRVIQNDFISTKGSGDFETVSRTANNNRFECTRLFCDCQRGQTHRA